MNPARTPQSPDTTRSTSPPERSEHPSGNTADDSLLFYATFGGSTLDPEVRLLAALIAATERSNDPLTQLVADELTASDFSTETYGELFELIVTRWRAGEMTDPGALNSVLIDQGATGRRGRELLIELVAVGVPTYRLGSLAKQVLIAWFHRGFQYAATTIQQIADEAPAHEKFAQLRKVGTTQAAADARVRDFHRRLTDLSHDTAETTTAPATSVLPQRPQLTSDTERTS